MYSLNSKPIRRADWGRQELIEYLMSKDVQLPIAEVPEETAVLTEEQVANVFRDHVPGVESLLFREKPDQPALQLMQGSYRYGWSAFSGTALQQHLVSLLRVIVHYGHAQKPSAFRYLQEVAEAFTSCQAVQARVVERTGLQICGVSRDFPALVTALVGEYKLIALKMLVAERSRASEQPIHFENRLIADIGDLIGINAEDMRRARLDTHAQRYQRVSARGAQEAARRCQELFDVSALLNALVCELNSFSEHTSADSLPGSFWRWCDENLREKHVIFDEDCRLQVNESFAEALLEVLFLGQVSKPEATFRGSTLRAVFIEASSKRRRVGAASDPAEDDGLVSGVAISSSSASSASSSSSSPSSHRVDNESSKVGTMIEALRSIWGPECDMLRERTLRSFLQLCEACNDSNMSCGLDILFHRTAEENIQGISELGLLVPDGANIRRAHGAKLGEAVYLSTDYNHGTQYGNVSILCLALPGRLTCNNCKEWPPETEGPCFFKIWEKLVVACQKAAQVLPLAVVQEENLGEMRSKAQALVSFIEDSLHGLKRAAEPTGPVWQRNARGLHPTLTGWQRIESRSLPGRFYWWHAATGASSYDVPH